MSEIATVTVELKDLTILGACVLSMGGQVLGVGKWDLYAHQGVAGWGFRLPKCYDPFIVCNDGTKILTDGDNLRTNPEILDRIKAEYALQVAESEANNLGYVHERVPEGVKVYFPNGAEVLIKADGHVEGFGFNGNGCDAARRVFADALGTTEDLIFKDEYFRESVKLSESGD